MNLLDAYQLVCVLHSGQVDKAGRPYIEHLTRVMLRVQAAGGDLIQQIAALFHDAIEDGRVCCGQLLSYGVPAEAVDLVIVLTKKKEQTYEAYVAGVRCHEKAIVIKLSDLQDNMDESRLSLLTDIVAMRLRKKYSKAIQLLI